MSPIPCCVCAKPFQPSRSTQKRCSKSCLSREKGRKRRGQPTSDAEYEAWRGQPNQVCPVCASPFSRVRRSQRCCSNACTVRGRRRRKQGKPESDAAWEEDRKVEERTDGLKTCSRCRRDWPLDADHFGKRRGGRWSSWCRSCQNAVAVARHRRVRHEVLCHYSEGPPQCACCGEATIEFLCIDHIHGGGNEHRRTARIRSGASFNYWIKRQGFPEGFQVLCHNCNMAKGFYGRCPHEGLQGDDH